jgi:glutathione S-transferase
MDEPAGRYLVVAGPGSPYSHKMRAVLRYRRIPHDWTIMLGGFDGTAKIGKLGSLHKPLLPVVGFADGTYWNDTTPIIHELEARHRHGRSVLPPTQAARFLARLIEDFSDEWLPVPLMEFRWTSDEDVSFCARRQMQGWLGAVSEQELAAGTDRFVARQQKLRTILGGGSADSAAVCTRQYEALLDILEASLSQQLFLFGDRPSIADFGLYGMLSQFVIDPTPARIMRKRAVRVYQWTYYLDDLSGHDGAWSQDALGGTAVRALVTLAGRSMLPMMLALARAHAAGEHLATYEVDGVRLNRIVLPYPVHCWLWLKQMFAELPEIERQSLKPLLEEAGFWQALPFAPGEAERVPAFAMS